MAVSRARGRRASPRDPIERFLLVVPWLSVAVPAALATAGLAVPERYRWAPLVASVVVFGLPHGAVDHLALPRLRGERADRRWLAAVGALYLMLGGAYAVVWFLSPIAAIAGFILLTWFHWGQGELHPLSAVVGAPHLDRTAGRGLTVAVRGGLPMLVPLLAHPARYRAVVERLLGLFDAGGAAIGPAFEPRVRLGLGLGFATLTLLALSLGYVRSGGDRTAWLLDAGEVALLWWFFWVVPPLVAVAVYFAMWHSVRHVGRLLLADRRDGGLLPSLRRFACDAAPLSAAALLFLAGLALVVPRTPATLPDAAALYLVLIALLTLPHVAVVVWMDREQGLY